MRAQQDVAFDWARQRIGKQLDVILDQPIPEERNVWVGRSTADAPDVDAAVYVTGGDQKLHTGRIVPCEIVATEDYDLVGVAVGKPH